MLRVSMFGSLAVSLVFDNHASNILLAARVAGLLAFLALGHGRFFTRSDIIRCFSADRDADISAGSLNTTLWRLRKNIERPPAAFGDFIVSNRQGAIGLNSGGSVWLDIEEFTRLTQGGLGKPLHQVTQADVHDLETGVSLYKSDILTEFNDDWVLIEREKLRRTYLNTLGRLMQISGGSRDYDSAIRYAQLILEADCLREDIHRELMRFYVHNGQRALAVRQFEICRERLKRELAIQPMPETMQLYREIAEGAIGHADDRASLERSTIAATTSSDVGARPSRETRSQDDTENPVISARRLIAEADVHLQRSLGLRR